MFLLFIYLAQHDPVSGIVMYDVRCSLNKLQLDLQSGFTIIATLDLSGKSVSNILKNALTKDIYYFA